MRSTAATPPSFPVPWAMSTANPMGIRVLIHQPPRYYYCPAKKKILATTPNEVSATVNTENEITRSAVAKRDGEHTADWCQKTSRVTNSEYPHL